VPSQQRHTQTECSRDPQRNPREISVAISYRKQQVTGRRERTIVEDYVPFVLRTKSIVKLYTLDTSIRVVPLDGETCYEKVWHPEILLVDSCVRRPS
jgi:hypothetical protein